MRSIVAIALASVVACESFSSTDDEAPANDGGVGVDGGSTDGNVSQGDGTTSCGDTTSDPENCGSCGHSCLGGACTGSKCEAVTLAETTATIPWLVTDATRVIWLTGLPDLSGGGDVFVCSKDPKANGCGAQQPTKLTSYIFGNYLGSDGTTAYVSEVGAGNVGLARVGADALERYPTLKKGRISWIMPRDGEVYVDAYSESDSSPDSRTFYRADVQGSTGFTLVAEYAPIDGPNARPTALAKDWVYLASINQPRIVAAPISGGAFTEVLSSGNIFVSSMTTDGERVYFSSYGTVSSCTANGKACSPRLDLSAKEKTTGGVVSVHWAAGRLFMRTDKGELAACDPTTSCASTVHVIAREEGFANAWSAEGVNIAVDERAIYYVATRSGGEAGITYVVKRIARGGE